MCRNAGASEENENAALPLSFKRLGAPKKVSCSFRSLQPYGIKLHMLDRENVGAFERRTHRRVMGTAHYLAPPHQDHRETGWDSGILSSHKNAHDYLQKKKSRWQKTNTDLAPSQQIRTRDGGTSPPTPKRPMRRCALVVKR